MKSVDIPDFGTVEFPDDMDNDAISKVIEKEILPQVAANAAERKRIDDYWTGRGGQEEEGGDRPNILSQFGGDLSRGVSQLQQLGYGLGALGADVVGADQTSKDWLQRYQDIGQDIQQNNPPTIGSYKNIEGVGDALRYGVEAVGENAAMLLPSLASGGLGAMGLRSLAQKGAAEFVESQVAKGVAREVAEQQAGAQIARAATAGGVAGSYPAAAGMEMGSIYGDVYEQTGEQAPGTSAAIGAVAGALDTVGTALGLNRIFGRELSQTATRSLVGRLGAAGAEQFVTEAPTEALQTILERTAVALQDPSKAVFSEQGIEDVINAGLKGGLGGVGFGVVSEATGSITDWARRRGVEPTQENLQNAAAEGDTQAIAILKASGTMSDEQLANLSPEAATRFAERYQGRRAAEEDPILAAQRTQAGLDRRDLEGGDPLSDVMRQRADRRADIGGPKREDILKVYDTAMTKVDAAIEAGTVKPEERDAAIRQTAIGLMPELDTRARADARTVAAAQARIDQILAVPGEQHTPELAQEYLELNEVVERARPDRVIPLGEARVDGKAATGYTDNAGLRQAVELRGRPNMPVPFQPKYSPHSDEEIAHQQALMRRQGRVVNAGADAPTPVMRDAEGFPVQPKTPQEAAQLQIQAEKRATGVNQLYGSENRLVQTPADLTDQQKAEQAMRLKEHLAGKAGAGIRDVRAGGRPQGGIESQETIVLDEGRPVRIVDTRTEPRKDGTTRTIYKVHRYDPRTGQAQTDENGEVFEYEVDGAKLTTGKYAQDPRQAQEFEGDPKFEDRGARSPVVEKYKSAKTGQMVTPDAAGQRADELQKLPRQTYRETPADPNIPGAEGPTSEVPGRGPVPRSPRPEQGEGPRVDMGSNKRRGEFRGDQTGAEATARRAEAMRRAKMREQSQRSQTQDEKTGEKTEWGKARSKYENQTDGYSSTAKGLDEDGWPLTDDDGFVLSDAGGPIRFEHKKDTKVGEETKVGVLTVLKAMRKQHPDAHLNPVAHPGPMRQTGAKSAEAYWTIQATQPKPQAKTGQDQAQAEQEQAAPEQEQASPDQEQAAPSVPAEIVPQPAAPEASRNDTVSTPEQGQADTETIPARNPEQLVASVEKGLRDRQVKPTPKAVAKHYEVSEKEAANALATIAGRSNKVIRQVKPSKKELAAALKPKEGAEVPAPKGPRYRLTPQFDEDMSLLEFLMSKGGLAANGDLTAMDAHRKSHPRYGNLVRKQGGGGLSLDEARELAEAEGYIGQGTDDYNTTTERDLLEAVEEELRGTRVTTERAGAGSERDQMERRAEELGVQVNPDWNDAELMVEIGEADAIANQDNPTVQAADNLREVVDAMLVELGIFPDSYQADFDIPFGDDSAGSDQGAREVGTAAEGAAETAPEGAGREAGTVRSDDRAAETRTGDAEEAGREGGRQTPAVKKRGQIDLEEAIETDRQRRADRMQPIDPASIPDPVNEKPIPTDTWPDERLLVISCGVAKSDAAGNIPAIERYTGPRFHELRRWMAANPGQEPQIVILSGKFGFIAGRRMIPNYDQPMTSNHAEKLVRDGAAENGAMDAAHRYRDGYRDVFIVGGGEYTGPINAAVTQLVQAGVIHPDAAINRSKGNQGVQKKQMMDWVGKVEAAPEEQAEAAPEPEPVPSLQDRVLTIADAYEAMGHSPMAALARHQARTSRLSERYVADFEKTLKEAQAEAAPEPAPEPEAPAKGEQREIDGMMVVATGNPDRPWAGGRYVEKGEQAPVGQGRSGGWQPDTALGFGDTPEAAATAVRDKRRRSAAEAEERKEFHEFYEDQVSQAKSGRTLTPANVKNLTKFGNGKVTTGDAKGFLRAMGLNAKQADDAVARVGSAEPIDGGWLYDLAKIIKAGQNILGVGEGVRVITIGDSRFGINEHNQVRTASGWQPVVIGAKPGDTYLTFNDGERDGAYNFLEDNARRNPKGLTVVRFNEGTWTARYYDRDGNGRTETGTYTAGDPQSIAETMDKLARDAAKRPDAKAKTEEPVPERRAAGSDPDMFGQKKDPDPGLRSVLTSALSDLAGMKSRDMKADVQAQRNFVRRVREAIKYYKQGVEKNGAEQYGDERYQLGQHISRAGREEGIPKPLARDLLDSLQQTAKTAAPKAAAKPKKPPKRKERAALLSRLFGRDPSTELTAEMEAADDAAWQERLEQIAPRAESVEDIRRILDENVERGILDKATAKGISDILARMPTDGLKGIRLVIQDRMTAEEREILGTRKGSLGEYVTFDDDPDTRVMVIHGYQGSQRAVETFVHENAHVLFDRISQQDKDAARRIYDSLPVSRQAMHTVDYGKDERFEEWFAESMVDYYNDGPATGGPRGSLFHQLGGLAQRLYKRIVDLFSNEKARIDAFFSGLEASLGGSTPASNPVSVDGITRRERRGVSTIAVLTNPIGTLTGDWKAWKSGFQELARDGREMLQGTRPNRQSAIGSLARWWFYSADGEYRAAIGKFNSPTLNLLADTFHAKAGGRQGLDRKIAAKLGMKLASNATFDEATTRKVSAELNQLSRILKPFDKDETAMDRIVDLVQRPTARRSDPESVAAGEIARLLKGLHTYMKDAGVDVGEIKAGYFPREIDVGAVIKNSAGFVEQATKAYRASGLGAKEAKEAADNWLTNILYGGEGSPVRKSSGTTPSFVQSRVLTKEADQILKAFYQRDPKMILGSYVSRAVKRAEIARRFGDNWSNWSEIEKQIRTEDPAAAGMLGHLRDYAATAAGVQQHNVSSFVRSGSSMVRTITSVSLLEKSTFSSIAEAIMPALRTGNLADLIPALTRTLNELRRDLTNMPPSVAAELAADIGAIAGSGVNSIMAARFAGGDPLGRVQAKVLETYFRRIGLTQWTDATRVAATERGAVFIRRLARDIAGKGWNPKSSRIYMEEMGIPASQLDEFVKFVNAMGDDLPTAGDLDKAGEMGAAYRTALLRFVDQTVMRPTTTTRPRWASHPVGSVLFQLQAFSYAFSKNVMLRDLRLAGRAVTEKDMGLIDRARLMMPLVMLLPLLGMTQAIVGDLRDRMFMDPERYKAQTKAAKREKALSRAGFTGALDPYLQMVTSARYSKDPISTLTGPFLGVFGQGLGALTQWIGNNSPGTNAAERKMAEALYDVVFEPGLNMLLGFSPVSPLTTAITMGFLPALRDETVDLIAGARIGHKQQKIFGLTELVRGKQFESQAGSWAAGG